MGVRARGGKGGGAARLKEVGVSGGLVAGGRITSSNVRRGNIDSTARRPLVPNRRVNGIGATPPPYRLSGLQATGPRRAGAAGFAPQAEFVNRWGPLGSSGVHASDLP